MPPKRKAEPASDPNVGLEEDSRKKKADVPTAKRGKTGGSKESGAKSATKARPFEGLVFYRAQFVNQGPLGKLITENGGSFSKSVTGKVNYVLVGHSSHLSIPIGTALCKAVPIVTLDYEFPGKSWDAKSVAKLEAGMRAATLAMAILRGKTIEEGMAKVFGPDWEWSIHRDKFEGKSIPA
eukprot:TRINITY_DN4424_c0_g1_i1.p2 TRINITY_DN4424_c0_g1~~TRINITY_DN4424_c0_g1_i1.p2  ORF type:complete len:181 (+),score=26.21 TRINITY_DN4424_c0_g1_i1:163-705(+)